MATRLSKLRIDEVSSVDRGAGEGVKIMLMKRNLEASAASVLAKGVDVGAAYTAILKSIESIIADSSVVDKSAAIEKEIADFTNYFKAKTEKENTMTEEEKKAAEAKAAKEKKDSEERDEKAKKAFEENAMLKNQIAVLKMSQKHKDYADAMEMKDDEREKFAAKSPDERDAHIGKNPIEKSLPASVQKALDEASANSVILKALQEKDQIATFAKRATTIGLVEAEGEMLRKAYTGDAEAITKLEEKIKGLTTALKASGMFKEIGKAGTEAGTAEQEMTALADQYRTGQLAKGEKCSPQQAFSKVYTDGANAVLKQRYDAESVSKRTAA